MTEAEGRLRWRRGTGWRSSTATRSSSRRLEVLGRIEGLMMKAAGIAVVALKTVHTAMLRNNTLALPRQPNTALQVHGVGGVTNKRCH